MKTKTALLNEQEGEFQFEHITLDEPKTDEVLVKVVASGVCHTDLSGFYLRSCFLPVAAPRNASCL